MPRRKKTAKLKPSIIGIYASVFLLVITLIAVGYQEPQKVGSVANVANTSSQSSSGSIDDVVATNAAAVVAKSANLSVAPNAEGLATSARIKSDLSQSGSTSIDKPQIIESATPNRSVVDYAVKDGDSLDSISAKFGVSVQTIKWANKLTSDSINPGRTLRIPPINGVLYITRSGDTVASIAERYSVDPTRLVVYNDLEIGGLPINTEIILPDGNLPLTERPGYVPFVSYGGGGGGYAFGYCTAYAYDRRIQLGKPAGLNWGNAVSWASAARAQGYTVNNTPSAGAVFQTGSGFSGLGHVAIVEEVYADGSIRLSEMNYAGWNVVSSRTISAGSVGNYNYIH